MFITKKFGDYQMVQSHKKWRIHKPYSPLPILLPNFRGLSFHWPNIECLTNCFASLNGNLFVPLTLYLRTYKCSLCHAILFHSWNILLPSRKNPIQFIKRFACNLIFHIFSLWYIMPTMFIIEIKATLSTIKSS